MVLDLKAALQIINSGDWFKNLRFITADVRKGTGGMVIELPKARITRRKPTFTSNPVNHEKELASKKSPRHHEHFTVNLELPNGKIRKVHPILITHINNQEVL